MQRVSEHRPFQNTKHAYERNPAMRPNEAVSCHLSLATSQTLRYIDAMTQRTTSAKLILEQHSTLKNAAVAARDLDPSDQRPHRASFRFTAVARTDMSRR